MQFFTGYASMFTHSIGDHDGLALVIGRNKLTKNGKAGAIKALEEAVA